MDKRFCLLAPVVKGRKGNYKELIREFTEEWFHFGTGRRGDP
ncbi:MAG: hypothetical protein ACLUD0_16705 [Eubacterium ramulus]